MAEKVTTRGPKVSVRNLGIDMPTLASTQLE